VSHNSVNSILPMFRRFSS